MAKQNRGRRDLTPVHNLNRLIRSDEVRITGEGIESKVCSIEEALRISGELGLDLIEISSGTNPAVCKIANYQKFLYDQKKNKKKPAKVTIKEIRFGPNTDDHDFNFKVKHAENFLSKGNKVKAFVFFRGREIQFKDQGKLLLLKFIDKLEEFGTPEAMPQLDGKRMYVWIRPKAKG